MPNITKHVYASPEGASRVLESPNYFLNGIDLQQGTFEFVETTREILSGHSFLDGRLPIGIGSNSLYVPIETALAWYSNGSKTNQPNRFIFHMSFCGSTLVARTLDIPSASMTYREPQILLELAEIKAGNSELYQNKQQWRMLVGFVNKQLGKPWTSGEAVVIKPSNWVNSMLPELVADGGSSRYVLLTISPMTFLIAAFRGGGERIQFCYRVLKHLALSFPEFGSIIDSVERASLSTEAQFSRLVLILHAIQVKAFDRVQTLYPDLPYYKGNYDGIKNQPENQLKEMVGALAIDVQANQLSESIQTNFGQHSKITQRHFDNNQAWQVNQQVMAHYGKHFTNALEWSQDNLTHQTLV